MIDSKGRKVCDVEFSTNRDGIPYISFALYENEEDGFEVPDLEIDYLNENYQEECEEYLRDRKIQAEVDQMKCVKDKE